MLETSKKTIRPAKMLRYLITASIVFYSIGASAQKLNPVLKVLDQLNKGEVCNPSDALTCNDETALYQQCAQEMCGPPGEKFNSELNDSTFDRYVQPNVMNQFPALEPKIKTRFDIKLNEVKSQVVTMKAAAADPTNIYDFSKWDPYDIENMAYMYNEFIDFKIDTSKPLSERVIIKMKPMPGKSKVFMAGADAYAKTRQKNLAVYQPDAIRDGLYTKDEAKALLKEFWAPIQADYEQNKDKFTSSKDTFDKIVENLKIDSDDNNDMGNLYANIMYAKYLVHHNLQRPEYNVITPLKCEGEVCRAGVQEYVKSFDLKGIVAEVEKSVQSADLWKDELAKCKADLATAGLKDSDTTEFLKIFPEVKKRVLEKSLAGFSEESRKTFQDYMENDLHLSFNPDKSPDKVNKFIKNLDEKPYTRTVDADPAKEQRKLLRDFMSDYGRNPRPAEVDLRGCSGGNGGVIWDSFADKEQNGSHNDSDGDEDPTKDNIQVSAFSCNYAHLGKSIVAHELGHALASLVRKKKLSVHSSETFMNQRNCVNKNQINGKPEETTGDDVFSGDLPTTEEDHADAISFMAFDDDKELFECALFETKPGTKDYLKPFLVNPMVGDEHSSAMVRVLREANYKKKTLAPACLSVMEKDKDKFGFNVCK